MEKELYKIACKACENVYLVNTDIGTTEFSTKLVSYKNMALQVLAIAGTNELADWIKNLDLRSSKGIKKAAVDAATEIHKVVKRVSKTPLLVTGHSKGGATAIAYKKLFGADYCVAFCPARSLRYGSDRVMDNTTIFVDKDDPVPKMGLFNFCHPICERVYLPNDFIGLKVSDHLMPHINQFVEVM